MLTYENLPQGKGHFFCAEHKVSPFLLSGRARTHTHILCSSIWNTNVHVYTSGTIVTAAVSVTTASLALMQVDCNSRLMHQNEQKEADSPGRCCLKACSPGWLWSLWSYTWSRSWANWHRPPETSNRGRRIKVRRHNRASSFVCARRCRMRIRMLPQLQLDSNSEREQSNKNSPVFYFGTYGRFLIIWSSNMWLFSQV